MGIKIKSASARALGIRRESFGLIVGQMGFDPEHGKTSLIGTAADLADMEPVHGLGEVTSGIVAIVPELAIQTSQVEDVVDLGRRLADRHKSSLVVAGMEFMTATEAVGLYGRLALSDPAPLDLVRDVASRTPDRPINASVIVAHTRSGRGVRRVGTWVQPKLASSKAEYSEKLSGEPVHGDWVYAVRCGGLNVMVLTCSDMITPREGEDHWIVDEVEFRCIRRASPADRLDLLVSNMHNEKMDHHRFNRTLDRIYGDGISARSLWTVMCNAVDETWHMPGASRLLVSGENPAPMRPASNSVEVDQNVQGVLLGREPTLAHFHLGTVQGQPCILHHDLKPDTLDTIVRRPRQPAIRFGDRLEHAEYLSSRGDTSAAIEWAEIEIEDLNRTIDARPTAAAHTQLFRCHQFTGNQYRHRGEYEAARAAYREANRAATQIDGFARQIATLRSERSADLCHHLWEAGNVAQSTKVAAGACQAWEKLVSSAPTDAVEEVTTNLLNSKRIWADMLRLGGNHAEAESRYKASEAGYKRLYKNEEQLFARAGRADCLRAVGKTEQAQKLLDDVLAAAQRSHMRRLEARVRHVRLGIAIHQAWLGEGDGELWVPRGEIAELQRISELCVYAPAAFSAELYDRVLMLDTACRSTARERKEQLQRVSDWCGTHLAPRADGTRSTASGVDRMIVAFVALEARRLAGGRRSRDALAVDLLDYERSCKRNGFAWGQAHAALALELVAGRAYPKALRSAPAGADLLRSVDRVGGLTAFGSPRHLVTNIP